MAWQIPEVNSCGAAALALFRSCYPLHRIFRRKSADNIDNQSPTKHLGWRMTGRSKAEAVSSATAFFKQGMCIVKNQNTLRELEVFVKKSSRMLPEAMDGTDPITGERYHDDEVTCLMLGIYASRQLPYMGKSMYQPVEEKKECPHAMVAGGICIKCRKKVKQAESKPLTFEELRATVKANGKKSSSYQSNAMLSFWLNR